MWPIRRMGFDRDHHFGVCGGLGCPEAHFEIEVVPADNRVLDQPVAGFGHLLILLQREYEISRAADGHGAREPIGQLDLVELGFDGHTQIDLVDVAKDEQGFDDPAERLEGGVEAVLLGIGIEPPENVRRRAPFELNGRDEAQDFVPMGADDVFIDC